MTPAVFFDRDNTLIHNDGDLGDPEQVRLIKGAASAIASLRGLGYKIVVVTNQGGVARGVMTENDVEAVHHRVNELVKSTTGATIDRFYYCPYHPQGTVKTYKQEHPWRKPQPGMLLEAAKELKLDLDRSWLIGDQIRDIQAAAAAGVRAVLIGEQGPPAAAPPRATKTRARKRTSTKAKPAEPPKHWVAANVIEAVKIIAQKGRTSQQGPDESVDTASASMPKRPSGDGAKPGVSDDPAESNPAAQAPSKAHARPFRPWMIQPSDDQTAGATAPHTDEAHGQGPAAPPQAPELQTVDPPDAAQPGPPLQPTPDTGSQTIITSPRTDQTLRQILQELRNRNADEAIFSYHQMIAIVLQMIAVVCLLGALWMGGENLELFIRWLCIAVFVQLATIAMLLFRK